MLKMLRRLRTKLGFGDTCATSSSQSKVVCGVLIRKHFALVACLLVRGRKCFISWGRSRHWVDLWGFSFVRSCFRPCLYGIFRCVSKTACYISHSRSAFPFVFGWANLKIASQDMICLNLTWISGEQFHRLWSNWMRDFGLSSGLVKFEVLWVTMWLQTFRIPMLLSSSGFRSSFDRVLLRSWRCRQQVPPSHR